MKHKDAFKIAVNLLDELRPHCETIHIAGSIRRMKPEVKDIELLAIPKKRNTQSDLFGSTVNTEVSHEFVETLYKHAAVIVKGKPDGKYMQLVLKEGIVLDLFMPTPEDYYRMLAIRTGSVEFVRMTLAHAWSIKGWCGTKDHGLRKKSDCIKKMEGEKEVWFCIKKDGELPPAWKSEEEFFKWLGIEYIQPQNRSIFSTNLYR